MSRRRHKGARREIAFWAFAIGVEQELGGIGVPEALAESSLHRPGRAGVVEDADPFSDKRRSGGYERAESKRFSRRRFDFCRVEAGSSADRRREDFSE